MQKPYLSQMFFNKGLVVSDGASQIEKGILFYNAGVQSIRNCAYQAAFNHLVEASFVMYNNPLLWVRIAECCIAYCQDNHDTNQTNRVKVYYGDNEEREMAVLLPTFATPVNSSLYYEKNTFVPVEDVFGFEMLTSKNVRQDIGEISMGTANVCLRNAMTLMMSSKNFHPLIEHILVKSAYVSLELCDPLSCLNDCKRLLSFSQCSQISRIAAICYGFEALCALDQAQQCFHLVPTQEMQQIFLDMKKSQIQEPLLSLHQSLLLNVAIVYITQGQFKEAQEMINGVNSILSKQEKRPADIAHIMYLSQVYILISVGDKKRAIEYILQK
ncbi:hypothetical protein AKO1_011057 [Acrasis kona]|uniref:CCR4-NOT transcription complex subunit 10 n=1 Tax=Acrasis kona TaxID=1008807 RepID=A0AAW2YTJ1_9EUKA